MEYYIRYCLILLTRQLLLLVGKEKMFYQVESAHRLTQLVLETWRAKLLESGVNLISYGLARWPNSTRPKKVLFGDPKICVLNQNSSPVRKARTNFIDLGMIFCVKARLDPNLTSKVRDEPGQGITTPVPQVKINSTTSWFRDTIIFTRLNSK